MGNQIHSYIISDKYAARVSNPYMYDTVRLVRKVSITVFIDSLFDLLNNDVFFKNLISTWPAYFFVKLQWDT